MPSPTLYAVVDNTYVFDGESRVFSNSTVSSVFASLSAANVHAWKEFADRVGLAEVDEDFDEDHPPEGETDQFGSTTLDAPDAMASWRVGTAEGKEAKDEHGALVTAANGGWGFIVQGEDSACEIVVVETKLVGEEADDDDDDESESGDEDEQDEAPEAGASASKKRKA